MASDDIPPLREESLNMSDISSLTREIEHLMMQVKSRDSKIEELKKEVEKLSTSLVELQEEKKTFSSISALPKGSEIIISQKNDEISPARPSASFHSDPKHHSIADAALAKPLEPSVTHHSELEEQSVATKSSAQSATSIQGEFEDQSTQTKNLGSSLSGEMNKSDSATKPHFESSGKSSNLQGLEDSMLLQSNIDTGDIYSNDVSKVLNIQSPLGYTTVGVLGKASSNLILPSPRSKEELLDEKHLENDLIPDYVRAFDESIMKIEKSKPRSSKTAAHINKLHCIIKEVENYDLRSFLRANERLLHAAVFILMDKAKDISLGQHISSLGKNLDKAVEVLEKYPEMTPIFDHWQSKEQKMERKRKRRDHIKESRIKKFKIKKKAYKTHELREQGVIKDEDGLSSEEEPEEDRSAKKQKVASWRIGVDQERPLEVQKGMEEVDSVKANEGKEVNSKA